MANLQELSDSTGQPAQPEAPAPAPGGTKAPRAPKKGLARRILRWTCRILGGLLLLVILCVAGVLVFLRTDFGRNMIQDKANEALAGAGVQLSGLILDLPFAVQTSVRLSDGEGVWLEAEKARLNLRWGDLPASLGVSVSLEKGRLRRLPPAGEPAPETPPAAGPPDFRGLLDQAAQAGASLPSWIPGVRIESLALGPFQVDRPVYDAGAREKPAAEKETPAPGTPAVTPVAAQGSDKAQPQTEPQPAGAPEPAGKLQAPALAVYLKGSAAVLPDPEKGWQTPATLADITLLAHPRLRLEGEDPAPGPGVQELPLPEILPGIALDMATVQLGLGGTLPAPVLCVEVRAGALSASGRDLRHAAVRLVLPEDSLPALRGGETGRVLLGVDAMLGGMPLHTGLRAEVSLPDNVPHVRVLPRATAPGLSLTGDLATVIPLALLTPQAQTPAAEGSPSSGTAPAGAQAADQAAQPQAPAASPAGGGGIRPPVLPPLPPVNGGLRLDLAHFALLSLAAPDMSARGSLSLAVDLACPEAGPQSSALSLQGSGLAFASKGKELASLESIGLQASLSSLDLAAAQTKADLSLRNVRAGGLEPTTLALGVSGSFAGVLVDLTAQGGLQSRLQAAVMPEEALVNLQILQASVPQYSVGLRSLSPCTVSHSGGVTTVKGLNVALDPGGKIALSGSYGPSTLQAQGSVTDLRTKEWTKLVPALPEALIEVQVQLKGSLQKPDGKASVKVTDLILPVDGLPPLAASVDAVVTNGTSATAKIALDEATRQALGIRNFVCEATAPLQPAEPTVTLNMSAPLSGKVNASGTLAKLWPLARQPNSRLTGEYSLDAKVSGTASAPVTAADFALNNSAFSDVEFGVQIKDITSRAKARVEGRLEKGQAEFTLSAKDGRRKPGTFRVEGRSDIKAQTLNVQAHLDSFAPLRRRDIRAILSGKATVQGPYAGPTIQGTLNVDRGRVELESLELPPSVTTLALTEGPKEKIMHERRAEIRAARAAGTKPVKKPFGHLSLGVKMEKFFVTGYGLDTEWKADLLASGGITTPEIKGKVEAVRGRLDLLGRRFAMNKGEVGFAGGTEALVDVAMSTTVQDVEASLMVKGSPAKLDFRLASKPDKPQDDIISYMLFGKPKNELSQFELLRLGATAASFAALGSGGGLASFGRNVTGLDVFNLSQNDGSTRLEMGRYVMDKLYVGVEQGADENSDTSALIQLELGPKTNTSMKSGGGNTSLGLSWKKDY